MLELAAALWSHQFLVINTERRVLSQGWDQQREKMNRQLRTSSGKKKTEGSVDVSRRSHRST